MANEYAQHKQAIENDLKQRVMDFRARAARQKTMLRATGSPAAASLTLIAQGDSWFDYPVPPWAPTDVIAHLQAMPKAPLILNLAHHGEAAEDMLGVTKLHRLTGQLTSGDDGRIFDAILFSGGGNDLAGEQFRLWLKDASAVSGDPCQGLHTERVNDILGVVQAAYQDLISARDKIAKAQNRAIPIFAHSYDFGIPNGKGVCGAGPWLKPGLDDRGWGDTAGRAIVKQLLTRFAELLDLLKGQAKDFYHVKTQGTLSDAQWANELHPTPDGFAAVSAKFVAALRERFPGRI